MAHREQEEKSIPFDFRWGLLRVLAALHRVNKLRVRHCPLPLITRRTGEHDVFGSIRSAPAEWNLIIDLKPLLQVGMAIIADSHLTFTEPLDVGGVVFAFSAFPPCSHPSQLGAPGFMGIVSLPLLLRVILAPFTKRPAGGKWTLHIRPALPACVIEVQLGSASVIGLR